MGNMVKALAVIALYPLATGGQVFVVFVAPISIDTPLPDGVLEEEE